ncbi:RILP-like protein 1, partial [Lamellibrachia satsuma]
MESPTNGLHVVDVYDMAISIGKEFEVIIDKYGSDVLTKLMPQVISVLEHLESLAGRSQKENDEVADLKRSIERLQAERTARENQRDKHERVC